MRDARKVAVGVDIETTHLEVPTPRTSATSTVLDAEADETVVRDAAGNVTFHAPNAQLVHEDRPLENGRIAITTQRFLVDYSSDVVLLGPDELRGAKILGLSAAAHGIEEVFLADETTTLYRAPGA